jgi:peptidoglycan/LPS O-acetylase OafA/YrhL
MREAKGHFFYVDWLRGGAAFLVFAYHARNLLFLDAGENPGTLSLAGNIFYFITGFGHVAVVVFFVLSGCVIARAVVPALEQGSWSWASYLVARVTRLWVVLLPGLLLTLACDALAWRWFPTALPHTAANYGHMLTPADHAALSGPTFMGNAFFLQTILVPCFGSNGALWSLANEF